MKVISHPDVEQKFSRYPPAIKSRMINLRRLILDTAREQETISKVEETLKWGEPSYLVKRGSTIRIDWKAAKPDQYAIYFKCTSKLVDTFKLLYKDLFTYEKSRAIVFKLDEKIPEKALMHCIALAMNYHNIKQLPLLGEDIP